MLTDGHGQDEAKGNGGVRINKKQGNGDGGQAKASRVNASGADSTMLPISPQ